MTPQARAQRCAELMWQADQASRTMGVTFDSVCPGGASCGLRVESRHTNGHNICHGGYIYSLADVAFAIASNSYNQNAVAWHNTITYVAAGKLGDQLTATACEVNRVARSAIYDVRVCNQLGDTIALFRGCSRTIKGQYFSE